MSTTTNRPVRIRLAMEDGPLPRSIKQVLPIVGNETSHVFVETVDEADLVIFTDVREIERGYSQEKSYACLRLSNREERLRLPENCLIIPTVNILVGLVDVINGIRARLQPLEVPVAKVVEEAVPLRPDALRILVIDDTATHIVSAKSGLAGQKLTTATGYEEAMKTLGSEKFDVVLTDLHLPMSSKTMGSNFKLGELVPYGVLLMVEAAHRGAKFVAVVTDLNHHADPFSAAFDYYSSFSVKIDGAKTVMMHAPMNADGTKDWAAALEILMKD
jgi:CheY-like chemotaxis protein